MAARDYYDPPLHQNAGSAYSRHDPPTLPPIPNSRYSLMRRDGHADSPVSPMFDTTPLHGSSGHGHNSMNDLYTGGREESLRNAREDSDDVPLREHFQPDAGFKPHPSDSPLRPVESPDDGTARPRRRRGHRELEKKGWFSGRVPWVVYFLSVVQTAVFIGELAKNGMRNPIVKGLDNNDQLF